MTDCSSIQGSTSSSSDVMTLTTAASSWCAIPTNSRIRVLRLVRPHHTRRMLMVTGPESNPSFGFAVRGGKEFGTGFFVSQVERNSEADLKGLRVGDQILRLNNFRVEDAVHKEFIRFINSQDRITLKVRGVGMLPIKDKENERLSWNVVKMHSVSNTPSESSYKTMTTEQSSVCSAVGVNELRSKDINVTLDVAPRTKLGLGICKGPEWKPGIFVQFTKDKSVAREAGLRPGDQILSVNSIDFSDVLFSEAVAVMKSSNKLEMIVRTAAGCDLFPGESSGYNSSASSVTGDQSPCWADVKQKRLTAVSEDQEPGLLTACWNEALYAEQRRQNHECQQRPKEVNKTIIKLSENGTSINNTYVANPHLSNRLSGKLGQHDNSMLKKTNQTTPQPSTTASIYTNVDPQQPGRNKNLKIDARGNGIIVDVQRAEEKQKRELANLQRGTLKAATKSMPTSSTSSMGPPKAPPPVMYGNLCNYSGGSNPNASSNHQSSIKSNNFVDVGAAGSSLSSAITEELKKRKEKQRTANNAESNNGSNYSQNEHQHQQQQQQRMMSFHNGAATEITMQRHHQQQNQRHQHQHHPQQEQQQASTSTSTAAASVSSSMLTSSSSTSATSPAKRAPSVRAVNSNTANCSDRGNTSDQHSALMDEFKRAHQRMFKNGFHERESKERQEALRCTTIMEDDTSHRTSRQFTTNGQISNGNDDVDSHLNQQQIQHQQQQSHQSAIPPPPPQFANSPPKANQINGNYSAYQTIKRANGITNGANTNAVKPPKPPSSPTPDYDSLQQSNGGGRSLQINSLTKSPAKHNGIKINATVAPQLTTAAATAMPPSPTKRTIRLGAVTIGEYEQQRKEPSKFDFIGNGGGGGAGGGGLNGQNGHASHGKSFQNELQNTLSRSKLKNGGSSHELEHKRDCPLRNTYGVENPARNQKQAFVCYENSGTVKRNGNSGNAMTAGSSYNGILKNGSNRNGVNGATNGLNGHSAKISEKTITFGN